MAELFTTFALCRHYEAWESGYKILAKSLGGIDAYGENTPIPLSRIIETNGLEDATWALRAVPPEQFAERDRIARTFAIECAEHVLPIFEREYRGDKRSRIAIETAKKFMAGKATKEECEAAAIDACVGAACAAFAACAYDYAFYAAVHACMASDDRDAERKWQASRLRELLNG